jgi:hypothetical protein
LVLDESDLVLDAESDFVSDFLSDELDVDESVLDDDEPDDELVSDFARALDRERAESDESVL